MIATLTAAATVIAWGIWLIPSQGVTVRSPTVVVFYATLANLVLAGIVAAGQSHATPLSWPAFALVAAGGAVWALSGSCAFAATARLGPARAMGTWAPLNVLVSLFWGGLLFQEFSDASPRALTFAAGAILLLLAGLLTLIKAREVYEPASSRVGYFWAITTGVLWGSYFLPVRMSGVTPWVAAWPMALGMFATAAAMLVIERTSPRLRNVRAGARLAIGGLLWGAGNYASLLLMEHVGTGRGFSIAQLCLVVNALAGIFFLRQPPPRTLAAKRALLGCGLATAGGVVLGLNT